MIRQDFQRVDPKRRATLDHKKKQFASPVYKQQDYPHRLNFYDVPPTAEITLEQFEQWAIDRLKILAEIEACSYRNKSATETAAHITPLLQKYLPLSSNTSSSSGAADQRLKNERQKDHYSHFILRLAFSATEDLRRRFVRAETMLFKFRFQLDDSRERRAFIESLNLDWESVSDEERRELAEKLANATPGLRRVDEESWYKVDWERVPELVERRAVLLSRGKAYVPGREQLSMIMAEFTARLERALELTSRALPRLDEDDRLTPILNHLSKNFGSAESVYSEGEGVVDGASITANNIDRLSQHFPLCMRNLHMTLRKDNHLKHFGRLQYTLFLKGIGLSLEECILFWRQSFKGFTDDEFNSRYKYNIRHAYGDVGGDVNRRGRGYPPYSCQKILSDSNPGVGQTHGCPYRHFSVDNLIGLLQATGVNDKEVLRGVREDVGKTRYHIACNRVFEWAHKADIKRVKEDGTWSQTDLDTIVHPNTYFKRSYLLKQMRKPTKDS
ncbi:DNA primase subunit PRI2 [Aspergillus clavatus NRRL 1]|uniref:DNA primase large subunit n=1 Tax=Aspergillus clavatus (strain ATCC 1007 / CBS 513.65 / DSM 816 / NCTC 3887 / NRRL 1 / QM 1276 / 107) TaxID=344612 RepID=A1CRW6_ASPCL|nr:DNA primase large subunit [Aspergillus clavatus NRRL 1]EAW08387.1 DNA primase large subunit [Aspergillus clavatus NRRL 1]